ncbi:MAG TPA: hypothetical protein VFS21_14135, partial [Roseiflexaceae bacterium]|nr:hypothetical protein [Roseiflexaceae bacterium]
MGWLRRLLAWQIALTRQTYGALADDEYRGLYIPPAEADILSADAAFLPVELMEQRLKLAAERTALAAQASTEPPIVRLARLFDLSPFESDVLLLALAPEI